MIKIRTTVKRVFPVVLICHYNNVLSIFSKVKYKSVNIFIIQYSKNCFRYAVYTVITTEHSITLEPHVLEIYLQM